MNDKIVAVTGATGLIGQAVVAQLVAAGRNVRALVEPGAQDDFLPEGVERWPLDVTDQPAFVAALADCSSLFHLAAIYQLWTRDPDRLYRVNVEGTVNAMLAAGACGLERIVHTSSIAAIGIAAGQQLADETTPWNLGPIANDYIRSKRVSEGVVKRFAESGLPVVIVNPAFPFGAGDRAPTPTGSMIASILDGRVPAVMPGGFCAIDVKDVAAGHLAAERVGKVGERYILGNHNISYRDFVAKVCHLAGRRPPRISVPAWLGQGVAASMELWSDHVSHKPPLSTRKSAQYLQRYAYFDGSKARRELALPCTPLDETIGDAVAFFQSHQG